MYLSKIFLSWEKSRNPYKIHQSLWNLFPDRPYDSRDFLFRVEQQQKGIGIQILLQSEKEPTTESNILRVLASREYEFSLKSGQPLRFRLRANPVKTICDQAGRLNGKGNVKKCRVPLIKEDQQRGWIDRKMSEFCDIESLIVQQEVPLFFKKENNRSRTGKIQTVLFDGILRVSLPDIFIREMKKGIGPAKVFGCGLLSISNY